MSIYKRDGYEQLRVALLNERSSFETHWRELAEFLYPTRTRFSTSQRNQGERRSKSIINSTPRYAVRTLQSGMHAGLTSPARPWMRLTTPDPDLAEYQGVKEWLHLVTRRLLDVFLKANLYTALPTIYSDMGCFGTAAMGILDDDKEILRAYTYPIGSYSVGLDHRGQATTFMRDYVMTVRQIVEEFGPAGPGLGTRDIDWSRISSRVKDAWDRGQYELEVEVTWVVAPNPDHDPRRLAAKDALPWSSCYFERGAERGGAFLRESGFSEFPVLVPRWDVLPEDTYGTDCPGMSALGDVKSLQTLERRKAKAIDKALDPPLAGPPSLQNQKTSLLPGDITYVDVREGMQGLRPIHEVRLEGIREVSADIYAHEDRINRAFFADLFLMLAMSDRRRGGQPVTAREIDERHEEKLLALGPVLERTNDDLLDPLVDRAFALVLRRGGIPEPPEELRGVDLKVEYISLMAQAQKLVGVGAQDRFLQSAALMAQQYPETRHKVNAFAAVNEYAEMFGINPRIVRTDDEATARASAEAQAAEAAASAEQLKTMAQAGKSLSDTSLDGNTALRQVLDEGVNG